MLDCVGKELNIGDKVVCSDMQYADLLIGEIVGFTPKKARVRYRRSEYGEAYGVKGQKEQLKESYQIFKYEDVLLCKDCKRWLHDVAGCTDFVGRCEFANYMIGANGYCLYGERNEK